jgi:hypothetical protein
MAKRRARLPVHQNPPPVVHQINPKSAALFALDFACIQTSVPVTSSMSLAFPAPSSPALHSGFLFDLPLA